MKKIEKISISDPQDPPSTQLETKWIDVNGREEHEEILRNSDKMLSLGLDPIFEKMIYLRRWGSWLNGCKNYSGINNETSACKE